MTQKTLSSRPLNLKNGVHPQKNAQAKALTNLMVPTIFYVLKEFTDETHPITAKQIADYCGELTGEDICTEGTVVRKLSVIQDILCPKSGSDSSYGQEIRNSMYTIFGGKIVEIEKPPVNNGGKKRYTYYFEPMLTNSDIDMICSAIVSNRFFTEEEKEYLLFREQALGSWQLNSIPKLDSLSGEERYDYREKINFQKFPPRPKAAPDSFQDNAQSTRHMLSIINKLYFAISYGYKVKMVYARYKPLNVDSTSSEIKFTPVHDGKEYILNPYATVWNKGQLYLLATLSGDEELPRHYRIDRIYRLSLINTEDTLTPNTSTKEAIIKKTAPKTDHFEKAAKIPNALKSYYKTNGYRRTFDVIKYTAEHPLMGIISAESYPMDCCLECDEKALPLIVDTFGTDIKIVKSSVPKSDDIIQPPVRYRVTVKNVQSDCLELYCIQNANRINVIAPLELRSKVINTLQKRIKEMLSL